MVYNDYIEFEELKRDSSQVHMDSDNRMREFIAEIDGQEISSGFSQDYRGKHMSISDNRNNKDYEPNRSNDKNALIEMVEQNLSLELEYI